MRPAILAFTITLSVASILICVLPGSPGTGPPGDGPYEEIWMHYIDEPARRLKQARTNLGEGNEKAASEEIGKTEAYLKLESSRATEEGRAILYEAIEEIEKLAREVKEGAVRDPGRLDEALLNVSSALAWHHYLKASDELAGGEYDKAAEDLKAAVQSLEYGAEAAGREFSRANRSTLEKVRRLAEELAGEGGNLVKGIGRMMQEFGKEIEEFGRRVLPRDDR